MTITEDETQQRTSMHEVHTFTETHSYLDSVGYNMCYTAISLQAAAAKRSTAPQYAPRRRLNGTLCACQPFLAPTSCAQAPWRLCL